MAGDVTFQDSTLATPASGTVAKYLAILGALFFALGICSRAEAVEPNGEYVVLVHGADVTGLGPWTMRYYVQWLGDLGYQTVIPTTNNDITDSAAIIKQAVDALPPDAKVHIVGAQIGGTSARYYLKFLGGADRIATYTSLDSSQYGVPANCWLVADSCPWHPTMLALNEADDTPGNLPYLQVMVRLDQQVMDGGVTVYEAPWSTHATIQTDAQTFNEAVLPLIQGAP